MGCPVSTDIILNVEGLETRAAIVEDGRLVEIHHERNLSRRFAGNIYLGRVATVLPGMQAAFIDVGLDRNAFLYIDDISASQTGLEVSDDASSADSRTRRKSITQLITAGQELLVQIAKEPIGAKGARVTTNVTLPGRYLYSCRLLTTSECPDGLSPRMSEDACESSLTALTGMAWGLL